MALFTYDVSLEQIEMPEPLDSSPPTPGNDHVDKVGLTASCMHSMSDRRACLSF